MWADQRVKVFHKVLFRYEECFINWSIVLYETSKPNKVQLCMKRIRNFHYLVDTKGIKIPLNSFELL